MVKQWEHLYGASLLSLSSSELSSSVTELVSPGSFPGCGDGLLFSASVVAFVRPNQFIHVVRCG